jgi:S-adenosylmethionine synthetase
MFFTSESVTSGHPDKICDKVSDSILDALLVKDANSKVAVDTWVKGNKLGLIGEVNTKAKIDYEKISREVVLEIGYDSDDLGFNGHNFEFFNFVGQQSTEINKAVDKAGEIGAGDQGIMFGMANIQTKDMMPLPIWLAHKLARELESFRKNKVQQKQVSSLRPDGKTQVTIEFEEIFEGNKRTAFKPKRLDTILISSQHISEISGEELEKLIQTEIIQKVLQENDLENLLDEKTKILINPSGSFVLGGPVADSGLTGRKIIVDSYGGWAFSGKDFSKVDRSGAYMARYLAKWIVKNGWSDEVEIQLSYAIGKAEPLSVELYGECFKPANEIRQEILQKFDLTPAGIIKFLDLKNVIYSKTASYGHFGRVSEGFGWEGV